MTEHCVVCRWLLRDQPNFVSQQDNTPPNQRVFINRRYLSSNVRHYTRADPTTLQDFYSAVELTAMGMGWTGDVLPILREPKHHGTGCQFGLCADHCGCAPATRKEWRAQVKRTARARPRHTRYMSTEDRVLLQRTQVRFLCTQCGDPSTHACVQHYMEMPIGIRKCAKCCTRDACQNATTGWKPCKWMDTRDLGAGMLKTCEICTIARNIEWFPHSTTYPGTSHICFLCTHTACQACGRFGIDHTCEACASCNTGATVCCRCNPLSRPTLHNPTLSFMYAIARPNKRHPSTRAIGVELEVNGFKKPSREALTRLYNTCIDWNAAIGTDGSCGDTGVEIRTSPACNGAFVSQLTQIVRRMKAANAVMDARCGLHVHVDVRDLIGLFFNDSALAAEGYHTPLDVITRIWSVVEPTFYSIVDATRPSGTYCKTWVHTLANAMKEPPTLMQARQSGWFSCWNQKLTRYQGLNLQALRTHSTVEFRLHQGTLNRYHIISWAQLCAAFVDACAATRDPVSLYQRIVNDGDHGRSWLEGIAPTARAARYIGYQTRKVDRQARALIKNTDIVLGTPVHVDMRPGAVWYIPNPQPNAVERLINDDTESDF